MFLNEAFTFNGVDFSTLNIYLCDFNEGDILNEIGLEYEVDLTRQENFKSNPMYIEEDGDDNTIELNLILFDITNKVKLTWTNDLIKQVYDILITDNFVEFKTKDNENVVYFFKVISIQKVFTFDRKGYLKVIFKSLDKHCYVKQTFTSSGGSITINNPSKEPYKPIIKINGSTSATVGDLQLTGLSGGTVTVDNLTCTVEDPSGNNLFSCCNRKWVTLNPGNNTLNVSGNIEIICLFPISM